MKMINLRVVIVILILTNSTIAENWQTYNHDNARSASTDEVLKFPLIEAWTYSSPTRPRSAWAGPAKWDGWSKVFELKDRMVFDKVFHVAAIDDHVYFGSSVDDQLYCIDAKNGEIKWKFFTEGPIRLAPSIVNDRVYFGSDDGYAYCVSAKNGDLIWKQRAGPKDLRVPGNGRMISKWPIRSGVVVVDGEAYCCAGVFPSEIVYLVALDARNGKMLRKTEISDLTAQGYMLASQDRLYVTTGRERPIVFDRKTGDRLFQVAGGSGGTYALLTGDQLIYGPGKRGEINLFGDRAKDQIAIFEGNHMIVTAEMSYLHTDTELTALDRANYLKLSRDLKSEMENRNWLADQLKKAEQKKRKKDQIDSLRKKLGASAREIDRLTADLKNCFKWRVACDEPLSLIRTGSALFAGGQNSVSAFDLQNGREIWSAKIEGNAYGLAIANGKLYVSTDHGKIYCFVKKGR